MRPISLALLLLPLPAWADDISVSGAVIPMAPPSASVHAAYFSLTNNDEISRHLINVRAEGYAMAHIHKSEHKDGVATMSSVDMVTIDPGQTVAFEHGGLHVMLMNPEAPVAEGETVSLTLEFDDGTTRTFGATVKHMMGGHGS